MNRRNPADGEPRSPCAVAAQVMCLSNAVELEARVVQRCVRDQGQDEVGAACQALHDRVRVGAQVNEATKRGIRSPHAARARDRSVFGKVAGAEKELPSRGSLLRRRGGPRATVAGVTRRARKGIRQYARPVCPDNGGAGLVWCHPQHGQAIHSLVKVE